MNITYAEEAIADIVEAVTYMNARNPIAAVSLDAEIAVCIERLAANEFDGPSIAAPIWYCGAKLLVVRVYHQSRRPITHSSAK